MVEGVLDLQLRYPHHNVQFVEGLRALQLPITRARARTKARARADIKARAARARARGSSQLQPCSLDSHAFCATPRSLHFLVP